MKLMATFAPSEDDSEESDDEDGGNFMARC